MLLPEFWTKSPEVWFVRIEAQFGTRSVTADQTKYDYLVSSLDANTAEEVQAVLLNPPTENKYEHLKAALLKTFGKSQTQKDAELLNIAGLGDRKPSALLRRINALNDDPRTLKRALFLANLPSDIKTVLAGQDIEDTDKLAEAADRVWETKTAVQAVSTGEPRELAITTDTADVNAFFRKPGQPKGRNPPAICFYHEKFGPEARRCQAGCKSTGSCTTTTPRPFKISYSEGCIPRNGGNGCHPALQVSMVVSSAYGSEVERTVETLR
ncbi:transposon Ty3-G Gag-Pol polyprotein [Elysia marginata]|uniref:Transposon Ty3-G Gag-Pol polyprotein n=1 Tax=Elysia marginata TaxID=1093978 RepID=A0AAV4HEC4_9GAST|nr:transposon Ty3-G Gag-Pol polyprotein [Elysia marginata]